MDEEGQKYKVTSRVKILKAGVIKVGEGGGEGGGGGEVGGVGRVGEGEGGRRKIEVASGRASS